MITLKIYRTGKYLSFPTQEKAFAYLRENGIVNCTQQGENWVAFYSEYEREEYFLQRQCISRFVYKDLVSPLKTTIVGIYSQQDIKNWKSALSSSFYQLDVFEPTNFIDNQSYTNFFGNINETLRYQIFKCTLNAYFHMMCNFGSAHFFKDVSRILLSYKIAKGLEYMILQIIFNFQQIFEDNLKSWEGMANEDSYNFKLHYGEPSFSLFGEDDNGEISFMTSSSYGQDHITLMIDSQLLKRIMSFTTNPSQYDVQNLVDKLRYEFLKIHMPFMNCEYNIQRIAWDDSRLWSGLTIEINISSFYCPY